MNDTVYRFAGFELHPAAAELRRDGTVTRLQEKPLRLLLSLLDHPQQVVTREQLRERLWDSRTVVEYELGINVAIKKVRGALGDSADAPRYIETVAKRGYRLLVPVSVEMREIAGPMPVPAPPVEPTPPAPVSRRRWWIPLAAVLVLGAFAVATFRDELLAQPTEIRAIAVLPLRDVSPEPGQEFFADGITEEITTNLAQMLPLRVISRTSVMQYRGSDKPMKQIAQELGVQAVVEGSVARSGAMVIVNVQLIDAVEDRHMWAEKYERRADDIMALEAELSQAIASQVSGTLDQRRPSRLARRVNPRVHELCLLGRHHREKRSAPDLLKAQEYYEQAIALDSFYAPAHAGLADVYALQPFYGAARFEESSPKAIVEARKALELDPSLAEAHATLGLVLISSRRWEDSAPEFRRALELNPNYATAHHWYSYYLRFANRVSEACAELEIARRLDPLSAIINSDQGEALNAARRFDEARISLRRAMELAPAMARPHAQMTVTALATGRKDEALSEAQAALSLDSQNPAVLAHAGYVFATVGDSARASQLLVTLKEMAARDINVSMYKAMVEAGLGQNDAALATLEQQAKSPHSIVLQGIQHWYAFQSLRQDERFRSVLSRAW
jgi:TolB-like protein/DNA-binding winged helix-turn-helix (wHTH) protein/Flp pilus assembly protein TadD